MSDLGSNVDLSYEDPIPIKKWILFVILAALLHLFLIWLKPFMHSQIPARIEIHTIDPSKLLQIKKQWKNRELLLSKKNAKALDTTPDNARYESDKNHKELKEQRAKKTDIIPIPNQNKQTSKAQSSKLKTLSHLGVPFRLSSTSKPEPQILNDKTDKPNESLDPSSDQAIQDPNLQSGSENLLNTAESVYYSYYSRMYESVGPFWQSQIKSISYRKRIPPGEYVTSVDVIFSPDGDLVEIRYLASSSIQDFDKAVSTAWHQTGRFSNPPRALIASDGYVHTGWTFTVHVSSDFNVNYLPPERNY